MVLEAMQLHGSAKTICRWSALAICTILFLGGDYSQTHHINIRDYPPEDINAVYQNPLPQDLATEVDQWVATHQQQINDSATAQLRALLINDPALGADLATFNLMWGYLNNALPIKYAYINDSDGNERLDLVDLLHQWLILTSFDFRDALRDLQNALPEAEARPIKLFLIGLQQLQPPNKTDKPNNEWDATIKIPHRRLEVTSFESLLNIVHKQSQNGNSPTIRQLSYRALAALFMHERLQLFLRPLILDDRRQLPPLAATAASTYNEERQEILKNSESGTDRLNALAELQLEMPVYQLPQQLSPDTQLLTAPYRAIRRFLDKLAIAVPKLHGENWLSNRWMKDAENLGPATLLPPTTAIANTSRQAVLLPDEQNNFPTDYLVFFGNAPSPAEQAKLLTSVNSMTTWDAADNAKTAVFNPIKLSTSTVDAEQVEEIWLQHSAWLSSAAIENLDFNLEENADVVRLIIGLYEKFQRGDFTAVLAAATAPSGQLFDDLVENSPLVRRAINPFLYDLQAANQKILDDADENFDIAKEHGWLDSYDQALTDYRTEWQGRNAAHHALAQKIKDRLSLSRTQNDLLSGLLRLQQLILAGRRQPLFERLDIVPDGELNWQDLQTYRNKAISVMTMPPNAHQTVAVVPETTTVR